MHRRRSWVGFNSLVLEKNSKFEECLLSEHPLISNDICFSKKLSLNKMFRICMWDIAQSETTGFLSVFFLYPNTYSLRIEPNAILLKLSLSHSCYPSLSCIATFHFPHSAVLLSFLSSDTRFLLHSRLTPLWTYYFLLQSWKLTSNTTSNRISPKHTTFIVAYIIYLIIQKKCL